MTAPVVVEPRFVAAQVKTAGKWRHAVLDNRDRAIVDYCDTEQLAVRRAAGMNRDDAGTRSGPLAVLRDVAACQDGHRGHDLDLVTDGVNAYAWGAMSDAVVLRREGTELVVTCGQPTADEVLCDHEARFRLDVSAWTSEPAALDMLAAYGAKIPEVH